MKKYNGEPFIPTVIDPVKIDQIKNDEPSIGVCGECEFEIVVDKFLLGEGEIKCPKCEIELTRVHYKKFGSFCGVVSSDNDPLTRALKTSRYSEYSRKHGYDPEADNKAMKELKKAGKKTISKGVKEI